MNTTKGQKDPPEKYITWEGTLSGFILMLALFSIGRQLDLAIRWLVYQESIRPFVICCFLSIGTCKLFSVVDKWETKRWKRKMSTDLSGEIFASSVAKGYAFVSDAVQLTTMNAAKISTVTILIYVAIRGLLFHQTGIPISTTYIMQNFGSYIMIFISIAVTIQHYILGTYSKRLSKKK